MNKIFYIVLLGLAVAAFGIPEANAAFIKDNAGCVLAAPDSGLAVGLVTLTELQVTETPGGRVNATCHFNIPEGFEPAAAIENRGFFCVIFTPPDIVETTTDSFSVVTPGGRGLLRCQLSDQNG